MSRFSRSGRFLLVLKAGMLYHLLRYKFTAVKYRCHFTGIKNFQEYRKNSVKPVLVIITGGRKHETYSIIVAGVDVKHDADGRGG